MSFPERDGHKIASFAVIALSRTCAREIINGIAPKVG
jgi:hypothetical protein